jgi:hypothetical protein
MGRRETTVTDYCTNLGCQHSRAKAATTQRQKFETLQDDNEMEPEGQGWIKMVADSGEQGKRWNDNAKMQSSYFALLAGNSTRVN